MKKDKILGSEIGMVAIYICKEFYKLVIIMKTTNLNSLLQDKCNYLVAKL
jgi:hypothetical protein